MHLRCTGARIAPLGPKSSQKCGVPGAQRVRMKAGAPYSGRILLEFRLQP
jgi:hypothetical protein